MLCHEEESVNKKILFVDDDINMLNAYKRGFRNKFNVYTASGGEEGLESILKQGPYAVIISDCRMPGMSGVEFLIKSKDVAPDSLRMMATGNADLQVAIKAVNEGNIFRFLVKPCDLDVLRKAIDDGIEYYRLVKAEKELLEKTLSLSESLREERMNFKIANRQLRKAIEDMDYLRRKAEASSQAKNEFLSNMSHEIRTPISQVIGMLHLVLDTELSQTQREYVNIAKHSTNILLNLVEDILDFSRIEARRLKVNEINFSLYSVIESVVALMKPQAEDKGLKLVSDISSDVPDNLVGDSERLLQIILNLLGNAVKFTENGKICIEVRNINDGEPVLIHFSIKDTGIGIPEQKLDTIFDSFTQVDGSLSRRYGGLGLGLSLSKRLVEMMGGRIWAESQINKGSIFHFTIRFGLQEHASVPISDSERRVCVNSMRENLKLIKK